MGLYFTNREDREDELAWMNGIECLDNRCVVVDGSLYWDIDTCPEDCTMAASISESSLSERFKELLFEQLRKGGKALVIMDNGDGLEFNLLLVSAIEFIQLPGYDIAITVKLDYHEEVEEE